MNEELEGPAAGTRSRKSSDAKKGKSKKSTIIVTESKEQKFMRNYLQDCNRECQSDIEETYKKEQYLKLRSASGSIYTTSLILKPKMATPNEVQEGIREEDKGKFPRQLVQETQVQRDENEAISTSDLITTNVLSVIATQTNTSSVTATISTPMQ